VQCFGETHQQLFVIGKRSTLTKIFTLFLLLMDECYGTGAKCIPFHFLKNKYFIHLFTVLILLLVFF